MLGSDIFLPWLTEGLRITATTAMSMCILDTILIVHESTMNSLDTRNTEVLSLSVVVLIHLAGCPNTASFS